MTYQTNNQAANKNTARDEYTRDEYTRDEYTERARDLAYATVDDVLRDYMAEEAKQLTGDDSAKGFYSLGYSQGDGACIEARAEVSRAKKGAPLEFYGLGREAWRTLARAEQLTLGKWLEHGGRVECWTEQRGNYCHERSTESHAAWERYDAAGLFSYDTDDYGNTGGGAATSTALINFETAVHEATRKAGKALAAFGYAEIEFIQDEAEAAAGDEWDALYAEQQASLAGAA